MTVRPPARPAAYIGHGPVIDYDCPICGRTYAKATALQARAAGWRLRDDGSVVACPHCWDEPTARNDYGELVSDLGWRAECWTCGATAGADSGGAPLTRQEADEWATTHTCGPDTYTVSPDPLEKP